MDVVIDREESLRAAVDFIPQGLAVFDRDLRLVTANTRYRELLALPVQLIGPGTPLYDIALFLARRGDLGPGDATYLAAQRVQELTGSPHTVTQRLGALGQSLEFYSSRLPSGGLVISFSDVTDRVAAQSEIADINLSLEGRVEERTADLVRVNSELEVARAKADAANRDKTRFLAAASHDLLQPLNAARLYTATLVERAGGTGQAERLDVTVPAEWEALRSRLRGQWERIDLVVNNAGVSGAGEVGRFSLEDWRWILDVNLFGVIHGCHYFVDWLAENPDGGHIVNMSSMAAVASAPTMGGYNVSKAAVISLSETLYAELLHRGVGVTVLCPGFVSTNLLTAGRWHRPSLRTRAERLFAKASITADDVAEATIRAIRGRRLYAVLPLRGRVFWRFKRLLPQWFMTMVAKVVSSGRG